MSKQVNKHINKQSLKLFLSSLVLILTFGFSKNSIANSEREKESNSQSNKTEKFNKTKKLAKHNKKSVLSDKDQKPKNLKKEMHFSDQLVNGKFQLPGDSAVEVENEKLVFNLLQIRADFNDRRAKEALRD